MDSSPDYSPKPLEPDLPIDLELLWLACRRNWPYALGVFIAMVGLSIYAASGRPPVYAARSKLLFRTDQTPLLTGIRTESSDLSALVNQNNPLLTETEVLLSQPLLAQVVQDLNLRDEDGELESARFLQKQISTGK